MAESDERLRSTLLRLTAALGWGGEGTMSDDVTDELRAADRRWTELRRVAIEDLDAAREQITSLGVEELRFMVLERVMLDTQSERVKRGRAEGR
jgi:hypothetical protein